MFKYNFSPCKFDLIWCLNTIISIESISTKSIYFKSKKKKIETAKNWTAFNIFFWKKDCPKNKSRWQMCTYLCIVWLYYTYVLYEFFRQLVNAFSTTATTVIPKYPWFWLYIGLFAFKELRAKCAKWHWNKRLPCCGNILFQGKKNLKRPKKSNSSWSTVLLFNCY